MSDDRVLRSIAVLLNSADYPSCTVRSDSEP